MIHSAGPYLIRHLKAINSLILLNFRYCEAFPAIKGAIQRVEKEKKRVQHKNDDKKSSKASSKSGLKSEVTSDVPVSTGLSSKNFTLQRRLSTATPVKYDMYLMNLGTMLNIFGSPLGFRYLKKIIDRPTTTVRRTPRIIIPSTGNVQCVENMYMTSHRVHRIAPASLVFPLGQSIQDPSSEKYSLSEHVLL